MIWQAEEGAMRALRLMMIVKSAKKDLNINLGLLNNQQTSVPRKFDKCSTQYGTLDSDDGFIDFKAK